MNARKSNRELYRSYTQIFTPDYPFSSNFFNTWHTGKAELQIWAKTYLASPVLYSLLDIPDAYKGYMEKGILISMNLAEADTLKSITDKANQFFKLIETNILHKNIHSSIYYQCKKEVMAQIHLYHEDYLHHFPALDLIQQPPLKNINYDFDALGKKMFSAVDEMDYNG